MTIYDSIYRYDSPMSPKPLVPRQKRLKTCTTLAGPATTSTSGAVGTASSSASGRPWWLKRSFRW